MVQMLGRYLLACVALGAGITCWGQAARKGPAAWDQLVRDQAARRDGRYPVRVTVHGNARFEDGGRPELALVEVYCKGKLEGAAHPDEKGAFSLECGGEPGETLAAMMSATEVHARFPDHESNVLRLSGIDTRARADIGMLILHRTTAVEGRTVSAHSLASPPAAKAAFEEALAALQFGLNAEARRGFETAVQLYAEYAAAGYEVGRLQLSEGNADAARASFERAIRTEPRYLLPRVQMLSVEWGARRWPELLAAAGELIRLNPADYPQAYYCQAVANTNLGDLAAAEKSAREADRVDPRRRFPKNVQLLGMLARERGGFSEAAQWFRQYLALLPAGAAERTAVEGDIAEMERRAAR